jgi:hypothetical protein
MLFIFFNNGKGRDGLRQLMVLTIGEQSDTFQITSKQCVTWPNHKEVYCNYL